MDRLSGGRGRSSCLAGAAALLTLQITPDHSAGTASLHTARRRRHLELGHVQRPCARPAELRYRRSHFTLGTLV